ncbi:MAG: hypothetical protein IH598_01625 [Bacteroidales bacterium]|nr:hypothetical protein [Bacteroidales bacterium]
MTNLEILKTRLIDRILLTGNQHLLETIDNIFTLSQNPANEVMELTSEQIEMLMMSEEDIKFNRLITQEELDISDEEWLS